MKTATARFVQVLIGAFTAIAMPTAFAADRANQNDLAAAQIGKPSSSELPGGWHFVRTHNPHGGADAVSIMHTADTSKSDPDLAGLVIRCGESSIEIVIVVLRPLTQHSRPTVTLGKKGDEVQFDAKIAPPGTAILLPAGATALATAAWRTIDELFIQVQDGQSTIRGVVGIARLQAAFNVLSSGCQSP